MTTLEARIDGRLAEFRRARESLPDLRRRADALGPDHPDRATSLDEVARAERMCDDEIQYLLDIAPLVRAYDTVHAVDPGQQDAAAAGRGLESFIRVTHKSNKNLVLQRYLAEVEKQPDALPSGMQPRAMDKEMVCDECDAALLFNSREAALVCPRCGVARDFLELSEANLSYEQEVNTDVVNYFAYKRLNHFTEWLNSLQAKENTEIPDSVIEAVRAEFKKARATTRGEIKPAKVRDFLKKLRLNKFYEHTHSICNILNGVPAPKLPPALEARLKHMFAEIQAPFAKHCPANRKNFLSYGYTLYKFCELLGEVSVTKSPLPPRRPWPRPRAVAPPAAWPAGLLFVRPSWRPRHAAAPRWFVPGPPRSFSAPSSPWSCVRGARGRPKGPFAPLGFSQPGPGSLQTCGWRSRSLWRGRYRSTGPWPNPRPELGSRGRPKLSWMPC